MQRDARLASLFLLSALAGCGPSQGRTHDNDSRPPDLAHWKPGNDPDGDYDNDGFKVKDGDCNDLDPRTFPGAPEICGDHVDQNCSKDGVADEYCDDDGDGYNVWEDKNRPGGDCNDIDPNINPGAYEVVGNKRDDNCDHQDEESTPSCDAKLFPVDAPSFARSMEICPPWLVAAEFNRSGDVKGRTIAGHFGTRNLPQKSESMALLSTGMAYVDKKDQNYVLPRPGTRFQGQEQNPLPVVSNNACTNGAQQANAIVNDMSSLTVTIKAPTNAKAFLFKFNFFSAEYSDYVGAQYNDMFIVKMTSKKYDGKNIVFDTNNQPVTVNNGFFQVCLPQPICSMCIGCGGNMNCSNKTCGVRCVKGKDDLEGTGYDEFIVGRNGQQVGGATGWLTTSAPVTPGETFTLQFFIFDGSDHEYDSAVLIDGFQWLFDDTVSEPVTG